MVPFLDDAPYAIQVVFWVGTLSGTGWTVGIIRERIARRPDIRKQVKVPR